MNHTAYLGKLSKSEKEGLLRKLQQELSDKPDLLSLKNEINTEVPLCCPNCQSKQVLGHGNYKGRKRYACVGCKKTFNDYTGTAMSGLKKIEKFEQYLEMFFESYSIRKAAKKLDINMVTIFNWRHKILSGMSKINGDSFVKGIVECDDKQLNISEKGNKKLKRPSYKRTSDRKTKRGVSNDKVSVLMATDRQGNPTMQVAKMGRIDAESIEKTIGSLINKNNIVCSDAHPSIICWAKGREIEHHTFIATKQHIKTKSFHVQHVNSIANKYERWIKPFYDVSTKYLPNYLNWFIMMEKLKNSSQTLKETMIGLVKNINAQNTFRDIQTRYDFLINTQYYIT